METKICSKCGEDKPLCEYSIGSRIKEKIYYRSACVECERLRVAAYRAKNREILNKKSKKYYQTQKTNPNFLEENRRRASKYREQNPEKIKVHFREYYQKNKLYILSRNKSYYKRNKNEISARNAQYKLSRRDHYLLMYRSYRVLNRDKVLEAQRRWHRNLSSSYVMGLIVRSQLKVTKQDINPELIQLKRLEIALKRKRKEITKK